MRAILLATALTLLPATAFAEIAVSANDGKQVRAGDGLPMVPTPDSAAIIAFSSGAAPKVIGSIAVCGTLMGPPSSVAVARDYSFALVTCPQKMGADDKNVPDNEVHVIGLDDPTHPKLLQTVEAGIGATGVFLSKKGDVALVTGTGDDSITLFTIKDRQLTKGGDIKLEAKAEPRDVLIAPDGKSAYALRFGDAKITRLAIQGDQIARVADYAVGINPDGGTITSDGRYLLNNDFGGVPGRTDKGATVVLDTKSGKITDVQGVGALPEDIVLSPDNKYAAAVVGNGSATVRNGKNYDTVFGKLVIFKFARGKLKPVTEAQLGHACQGMVWSDDGKRLLVQCSVERDIRTFDFDGKTIMPHPEMTLSFESRPGSIATARTR
jgi:DNA-binding beta-propeller fold protein YncE